MWRNLFRRDNFKSWFLNFREDSFVKFCNFSSCIRRQARKWRVQSRYVNRFNSSAPHLNCAFASRCLVLSLSIWNFHFLRFRKFDWEKNLVVLIAAFYRNRDELIRVHFNESVKFSNLINLQSIRRPTVFFATTKIVFVEFLLRKEPKTGRSITLV